MHKYLILYLIIASQNSLYAESNTTTSQEAEDTNSFSELVLIDAGGKSRTLTSKQVEMFYKVFEQNTIPFLESVRLRNTRKENIELLANILSLGYKNGIFTRESKIQNEAEAQVCYLAALKIYRAKFFSVLKEESINKDYDFLNNYLERYLRLYTFSKIDKSTKKIERFERILPSELGYDVFLVLKDAELEKPYSFKDTTLVLHQVDPVPPLCERYNITIYSAPKFVYEFKSSNESDQPKAASCQEIYNAFIAIAAGQQIAPEFQDIIEQVDVIYLDQYKVANFYKYSLVSSIEQTFFSSNSIAINRDIDPLVLFLTADTISEVNEIKSLFASSREVYFTPVRENNDSIFIAKFERLTPVEDKEFLYYSLINLNQVENCSLVNNINARIFSGLYHTFVN